MSENGLPDELEAYFKLHEPSKLEKILSHPVTFFIYGCFWGSLGIIFWQTQILTNFLIEHNISPLLGIFVTGICLVVGYLWGYGNYDEFKKWIKQQNSTINDGSES